LGECDVVVVSDVPDGLESRSDEWVGHQL
jgi:hypothetical protein